MSRRLPEGFYRQLVESAGNVIAVLDEQGVVAFVNNRVQDYSGFTADGTVGKHYTELVHPEDHQLVEDLMEQARSGSILNEPAFRVVMPDGTVSHWVANVAVMDLDDRHLMMAICRDVSESVQLKCELIERNKALAALGQIAVALSSCDDLDKALSQALDEILSALGLTIGAVVIEDPKKGIHIAATTAPNLEELSAKALAAGRLISVQCMQRGERIVVADVYGPGVDPMIRELSDACGVKAFVALPLISKDNARAALTLGVPPPGDLSDEQNEFLQSASGILGPAIENAALHRDLTDRVGMMAMLEHLAKSVNSGRDVRTVLGSCMCEIAQLVSYDVGMVVLFERGTAAHTYEFLRGGEPSEAKCVCPGDLQAMGVPDVVEPTVITGCQTLGREYIKQDAMDKGCAVVVPLVRMDERIGVLEVWSREAGRYGPREVSVLAAAAEHLAIAASNAAMHEKEQQRSLELAALASEVRHRIKNNLQMISGLLEMSGSDAESGAKTVRRCLKQVRAISNVHDMLNPDDLSSTLRAIRCLENVGRNALQATGRGSDIDLTVTGDDWEITPDAATALGVMINELVSNAVEHGFRDLLEGLIEIRSSCSDGCCSIEVLDNGVGLPADFVLPEQAGPATGLGLVSSLTAYGLGGKLELESGERGVCARIIVKGANCGIACVGC